MMADFPIRWNPEIQCADVVLFDAPISVAAVPVIVAQEDMPYEWFGTISGDFVSCTPSLVNAPPGLLVEMVGARSYRVFAESLPAGTYEGISVKFDFLISDLAGTDSDIETAVILSLFTWRRAQPDDRLPDFTDDRRGWFGDALADVEGDRIGSRLWLLAREKMTAETVARAREYAREALQWMIADRVAARIEVTAERAGVDRLDLVVTIYRGDGTSRELRFADAWEIISNA